jgi:uncharacterized protein
MNCRILNIIIFFTALLYFCDTCKSNGSPTVATINQEAHLTYSIIEQKVRFKNTKDGAQLAGTLTLPNTNEKIPAVILITGSGLQDRDETVYGHKPFKVLAEYLSCQGIAVLRYDDRGVGESTGPLNNITPEDFARDAYAGFQYLKSNSQISNKNVGLIGHSMGSVEGSILASRHNDISFLIMLGGLGIPLDENMLKADSVNNLRSGQNMSIVNAGQTLLKMMISEVKMEHNSSETEINLNRIINDWRNSLPIQGREEIDSFTRRKPDHWRKIASEWATPYFKFVLNYDPYPVLTEIKCPVLSLIGEKDVQTLPIENSHRIKRAFENGKCSIYRIEILKDLNHLFQNCKTGAISEYSLIEETFSISAMELITDWIKERVN